MPCCLLVITAFFPRIALFVMWVSGYGGRAFESVLWPILGFFLMPYTTCAFAIAQNETGGVQGWTLIVFVIAVVVDVGHWGGGGWYGRDRSWRRP